MPAQIDHLVVVASTLEQGVAWCEASLGVTPGPGGQHPLMGTHNRLLRIATVDFPRAYLEIIAINPQATVPDRARRWFDLDDQLLRAQIETHGPRLAHFVVSVPQLDAAVAAVAALDIDRGEALEASRMTERGLLQWRITVRRDGQRLFDGALPTLIEWGDTHPAGAMPPSGITLQSLTVTHPQAALLRTAYDAIGLSGVAPRPGPANLAATLNTPGGSIVLESNGL